MARALVDHLAAPISAELKATLTFLERATLQPAELSAADAQQARSAGVSQAQLESALAVCAVFNVYDRLADATGFSLPPDHELDRKLLTRFGYPP